MQNLSEKSLESTRILLACGFRLILDLEQGERLDKHVIKILSDLSEINQNHISFTIKGDEITLEVR
jgi:hypothetical protein